MPPHISTRRLGIKSNRHDTLSSGITIITVSQDILMIRHNIWVTRLHISKLPLNILTSRPSIKVNRHNILVVYICGFLDSHFPHFYPNFPHFFLNLKIRTTFLNLLKILKNNIFKRYIIQNPHIIYPN